MRNREYRDQMEQIKPDAAALERLYAMVDGQTAPRQRRRRLGRRVVTAAAVCAGLHEQTALCSRKDAPPVSVMAFALIFRPPFYTWAGGSQENAGRKPGPRSGRKGAFFTKNLLDTPAAYCAILYLSG